MITAIFLALLLACSEAKLLRGMSATSRSHHSTQSHDIRSQHHRDVAHNLNLNQVSKLVTNFKHAQSPAYWSTGAHQDLDRRLQINTTAACNATSANSTACAPCTTYVRISGSIYDGVYKNLVGIAITPPVEQIWLTGFIDPNGDDILLVKGTVPVPQSDSGCVWAIASVKNGTTQYPYDFIDSCEDDPSTLNTTAWFRVACPPTTVTATNTTCQPKPLLLPVNIACTTV